MIHQQDILEDILSRLPAKTIGRFRCVSKPWRTLLSQPHFIKTHLIRTKQSPFAKHSLIIVTTRFNQAEAVFTTHLMNHAYSSFDEMTAFATHLNSDDHQFDPKPIIYGNLSSCDGLTLFQHDEILLANLTTKVFKQLPVSPHALVPKATYIVSGVGYDSVSDDYKVVTIYFYGKGTTDDYKHKSYINDILVDVYSVKKGTWKKVVGFPNVYTIYFNTPGVFVNGHIHWPASRTSVYTSAIVAYDLSQEKFSEFPPPSFFESPEFESNDLLTLEGCLCLFVPRIGYRSDVWMMKEYGVNESWIKIMVLDPEESYHLRPLSMLCKEELLLAKNIRRSEKKLFLYNLMEKGFKDIQVHGITEDFCIKGTFTESLVSPHCSVEYV